VRANPRRIGILGGTFDPVHNGHLDIGDAAVRELDLQRLFVVTAHVPPHRREPFASAFHRFAMVAMAAGGRERWRASDLELRTPAPSYTSMTLKRFLERGYAPCELFFVLGADAFADIRSWRDFPNFFNDAHFVVVSRPGSPVDALARSLPRLADRMVRPPVDAISQIEPLIILIDTPTADVSSTAIRQRCEAGQSIAGLVPSSVEQHIAQHGLYTSMTPGRRASDAAETSQAGRLHGQD
jgi:nicotinate-nucleotide adenylyltransferase